MNLKQLINKSTYSTIGYITSQDNIDLLESYILYNLPVLKEFKQVIVVTNYPNNKDVSSLKQSNKNLWKNYFPECIVIDLDYNRGHSFGIADSENAIVDYCKQNNIEWLCKSANDVVFKESILDIEIQEADFYYLKGMGYGRMVDCNFELEKIMEVFYPQSNFYFINVPKIDYLYDKEYVNKTYDYIQSLSNYNGKVWEYIEGWTCEDFLKQCVERNKLTKFHLISVEKYHILLQVIKENIICDCSHKNIMIEGICHFQYSNQPIIEI